jgi:formylglycine-generating enzyme required for sulfatase activity
MKRPFAFLLLLCLAPYCQAQTNLASSKADFDSALSNLETVCATQKADAMTAYGKDLSAVALSLRQAGDLEGYLAAEAEKKRFEAEQKVVADDAAIKNSGVLTVIKKYRAAAAKAEQNKNARRAVLLKSYVAQLDAMVKQLVTQDKIDSAKKVQDELRRAKASLAELEPKAPAPTPPVEKGSKPTVDPKPSSAPQVAGGFRAIDLGDGLKMDFVLIPAGSFAMGSTKGEVPPTKVAITKAFYISKCEVTQEQWEALMGGNPSSHKDAKNPVETVSWGDCQNFLSKLQEKANGMDVRLPTSAEWEYACRAGSKTEFCYGNEEIQLSQYGWWMGNSDNATHPVGAKKANAWGLYDMHGNVWEWCSDWDGEPDGFAAKNDPAGPPEGTARTRRGGSFDNEAGECRSCSRIGLGPDDRASDVGFRVVVAR